LQKRKNNAQAGDDFEVATWVFRLEKRPVMWDNPHMVTLKADDRRRVQIPDAKPGQVFAYEHQADGAVVLTPVKAERKERFPEGSLKRYAGEPDEEFERFIAKTVIGIPK
jgi:hypothetical protein